jgi:hypothetical protein
MRTIEIVKVRAMDLKAGMAAIIKNGEGWSFIYDVYVEGTPQGLEEAIAAGYKAGVSNSSVDSRDTIVRYSHDEDRRDGPENYLDRFHRFWNPYELVLVQWEVDR